MNIAKNIMIPLFKLLFQGIEFTKKNKHWTTNNLIIPANSNNVFAVLIQCPHFHKSELSIM
jgi:hypothetical protein